VLALPLGGSAALVITIGGFPRDKTSTKFCRSAWFWLRRQPSFGPFVLLWAWHFETLRMGLEVLDS
jgi:hypothetical protein